MMLHPRRNRLAYYRLPGTVFVLLLLFGCLPEESSADRSAAKPSSPLQLSLQPLGSVSAGSQATFEAKVSSTIPASDVTVEITLSPALAATSGTLQWQGVLQPGEPHRMRFTVLIPATGSHRLHARAHVENLNGNLSTESVFLIGAKDEEAATGIDSTQRPPPPTGEGRPVREYELR